MATSNILILHEDKYGDEFLKKIVRNLNINTNISYELLHKCNTKTARKINAFARLNQVRRILVITDAEGNNIDNAKEEIYKHIPKEFKDDVKYIIFKYCIEEWILWIRNKS